MQRIFIITVMVLAGCANAKVVQVNPNMFVVSATSSNSTFTGTDDAVHQVYLDAEAFCAKQGRKVDTDSLAKLEQDLGRPGLATLRFRCILSGKT